MSGRLGQHTHGRTEQQGEYNQHTNRIECVLRRDSRRTRVARDGAREMVHCDNGDDEQNEDDKGDEDVDHLVDARRAIQKNVRVDCFGIEFRGAEETLRRVSLCD